MVDSEPSHRMDVLLVEDNEDHVAVAQRLLSRSGALISLRVCRDGEEALQLLHEHANQDDARLPTLSGTEVLRRMKADRKLHTIPIVVLTGLAVEEQVEYVTPPGHYRPDVAQLVARSWQGEPC
jgi:chemosensory pili system protein ChpA (sensor histidine kinase/response regulator)